MRGVINQVLIKFTSFNQIFLETPYAKEHVTDWHDKLDTVQNYNMTLKLNLLQKN